MDHALKKTPAVGIDVVEVASHAHHALGLLRPGIDLVRSRSVSNFLNDTRGGIRCNFRRARPTSERYLAKWSAIRERENSENEVFVFYRYPAKRSSLEGFFTRVET